MTPTEQSKTLEVLELAAGGSPEAFDLLKVAVAYFHYLDDIVDGDIVMNAENMVICKNLLLRIVVSKFFTAHQATLTVILLLVGDDYVASENEPQWKHLRHSGNNFVRAVALLTGGEPLMKKVGVELRKLSQEYQYAK